MERDKGRDRHGNGDGKDGISLNEHSNASGRHHRHHRHHSQKRDGDDGIENRPRQHNHHRHSAEKEDRYSRKHSPGHKYIDGEGDVSNKKRSRSSKHDEDSDNDSHHKHRHHRHGHRHEHEDTKSDRHRTHHRHHDHHHRSSSNEEGSSSDQESTKDDAGKERRHRRHSSHRRRHNDKDKHKDDDNSDNNSEKRRERRRRRRREREEEKSTSRHRSKSKSKAKSEGTSSKIAKISDYQIGKYGIIRDSDLYTKDAEFRAWLMDIKNISPEQVPLAQMKIIFKEFAEDYNTATLPHVKYYNLDKWERENMDSLTGADQGMAAPELNMITVTEEDALRNERRLQRAQQGIGSRVTSYTLGEKQIKELRRIEQERISMGKMKQLGMQPKASMGVRYE